MIIILDFGSQSTHLIQRRLNDLGYQALILSSQTSVQEIQNYHPQGIIFSGSPASVYELEAPNYDLAILSLPIPKLGICYGFQCTVHHLGGTVTATPIREYGECPVSLQKDDPLFQNIPKEFITWMSHGDSITNLPNNFITLAESESHPAAAYNQEYNFWGLQFHPELAHSQRGSEILNNFAHHICQLNPSENNIEHTFHKIAQEVQAQVKDHQVLILVSGGVDSSVAAAVLLKSLNPNNIHLMYIDTGLMRKNESEEIRHILYQLSAKNVHIINAQDRFFKALHQVTEPEEKRKMIGDLFVQVTMDEVKKLGLPEQFYLAQGTLYTDLIESGKGVGKKAHTIKSHHNVNSPLIIEKRESGYLVEPLKDLYKDNVRSLGLFLGLPENLIFRHPFPGPGLGIRIIGTIDPDKVRILQEADAIYIEELRKRDLYHKIWQAFAVFISIKSVGVAGDVRKYGYTIALRAIVSVDGISADIYDFSTKDLKEISSRITNEVPEIARVVYDISSKPPATIEWE
ncbi:MAG: glutamine-hydrolyzing GMP synthase [Brevinema sp.]